MTFVTVRIYAMIGFIQLNSVASLKNFVPFSTYSASKVAAYSVTQSLREMLSDQGTAVISVHQGPIATDMANNAGITEIEPPDVAALKSGDFHLFPDAFAKQVKQAYQDYSKNIVVAKILEA